MKRAVMVMVALGALLAASSASAFSWDPLSLKVCLNGPDDEKQCYTWSDPMTDFTRTSTSCSATSIDDSYYCDFCESWKVTGVEGWDNADGVTFAVNDVLGGSELVVYSNGWFWDGAWDNSDDQFLWVFGNINITENDELDNFDYASGDEIFAIKLGIDNGTVTTYYCMELVWD